MGDSINIDWNAGGNFNPDGALGVVKSGYAGAEEGYKLGQAQALVHALRGIDLNSPASIDAGIGNLVHANAGEQANALQNLSFTRSLRQQIPGILAKMAGGATPAGADAAPQVDPQHAIETFTLAKKAADTLADTPEEDRPAAFEAIKKSMLDRGIPEAAIDSAGQHLAGDGPKQLSDYYGGLLAHATHQVSPVAGADAPPVPAAHPSAAWYNTAVNDPSIPLGVSIMKSGGLDLSPYLETARALAMPGIQKGAEIAAAPTLAGINVAEHVATAAGLAPIEVNKAIATEKGTLPYKAALANAEADISARHDVIQIPELDDKGEPTGRSITYRKDTALEAGAGGKPIGGTRSPDEQAGRTSDANVFMKNYDAEANQPAIQADRNARDLALAGAHMAQTFNPSNLTPWKASMANTLQGLGIKNADASDLATYQNLVALNMKNATAVFPRLTGEFHAVQAAAPTAKTPGDAAALGLAVTAATRGLEAQQKEFRRDWAAEHPGKYSERDYQNALMASPLGHASIFAQIPTDLKFNGKPVVAIAPPFTEGRHAGQVWGFFMPGTPQQMKFRVR